MLSTCYPLVKKGVGGYRCAMITAYTGLAGSGKTYHMTELARRLLAEGREVFSTYEIEGARLLEDARQLIRINNADIFFDEMHQDYDAKQWYNLDPVVRHVLTQHRKYGQNIHWSAQDWHYMDSFVRRNTDFCWQHVALFRDPDTGMSRFRLHRKTKYAGWEIELNRRKPTPLTSKMFFIKKNVTGAYDSYKKIALTSKHVTDEELEAIKDPYDAPTLQTVGERKAVMKARRNLPAPTELVVNENTYLENEVESLQNERETNQEHDSVQRDEPTYHADPSDEQIYPTEKTIVKRSGRRKKASQPVYEADEDG